MRQLRELQEQRAKLIADARAILETADKEKRSPTAEEDTNFKRAFDAADELRQRIDRETQLIEAERDLLATRGKSETAEERAAREAAGAKKPDGETRHVHDTDEYRSAFNAFLAGESRALQAGLDTAGGFTTAPLQFVDTMIKGVDDQVFLRPLATKFRVESAQKMGAPILAADPSDADWTSELSTGSEDSTMSYGRRELAPTPVAKRIKISDKLLRLNPSQATFVASRLAYKFAITQEKAFLTGHGANQPLGIFTASANGINTDRDVSTGSATAITYDGVLAAKYALKAQYQRTAQWLFHRSGVLQLAKLVDGDNRHIWMPSAQLGQPDMLLGSPVNMSEYVPSTFTSGLYVGMYADFSWYWIADALDMGIQRLNELYAETAQVGFIGRMESDGAPVLAEAFARLKTA